MIDRRHLLKTTLAATALGFQPVPSFGSETLQANGFIKTNWSQEKYSYGSYSYIPKGAKKRDHKRLGEPEGERLFFAGEAAHPNYNSTVHAAYESGQIAARAVLRSDAQTIAVIGAGMAGLAAANALRAAGKDVQIYEASG